jgi:hypothetical protein
LAVLFGVCGSGVGAGPVGGFVSGRDFLSGTQSKDPGDFISTDAV